MIGRWTSIYKLAEHPDQIDFSPYHYVKDNPIRYNDPDGNCPICIVWGAEELTAAVIAVFTVGSAAIIVNSHHSGSNSVMQQDATRTSAPTPAMAQSHGNKLDDKPAERYTLRDKKNGDVVKQGETTKGEDANGQGNQKRYSKKELKEMDADYQKENSGTKKDMHQEQHEEILKHKEQNNGQRPKYNKNDY